MFPLYGVYAKELLHLFAYFSVIDSQQVQNSLHKQRKIPKSTKFTGEMTKKKSGKFEIHFHLSHFKAKSIEKKISFVM